MDVRSRIMAQDSMDVLTRARDYFPFSFASPEARAAAATALENAGVGGSELELARLARKTDATG